MTEPSTVVVEPVGGNPIGASGMPVGTPTSEPTPAENEPASGDANQFEDVDFEDLKSVPPQFQKIAKEMQKSFTKKMQALSSVEKNQPTYEPPTPVNPTLEDAKSKVNEYMASPEGSALKEVFESMVNEKLGNLPQEVMEQKIDREVNQVVKKYGEDIISQHYEEIESAAKENPNIPLDYVVSNILYNKAKEIGANEYKSKIVRKSQFSDPASSTSSNVVSKKDANSFDEAFENAKSSLGF